MQFPDFISMIDNLSKTNAKVTLRRGVMKSDDYESITCESCPIKTVKDPKGNVIPWRQHCVKQPGPKILAQIAEQNKVLLGKEDITPGMVPAESNVDPGVTPCERMLFIQNIPTGEGIVLCIDVEEPDGGIFSEEEQASDGVEAEGQDKTEEAPQTP